MKPTILLFLSIFMLISCKESVPPLSKYEKQHLLELKKEFNQKNEKYKSYKAEKSRITIIEKSYLTNSVKLQDFSIFKTNNFDDGRDRACYKGILHNHGNDIIESLDLKVSFFSKGSMKQIETWETSLVSANDELLDNIEPDKNKALIMAISGRKLPLKPKASLNLSKNKKRCFSEVFLNWEAKDVRYELVNLKLRPKLAKVDPFHSVDLQLEIAQLEKRQGAN